MTQKQLRKNLHSGQRIYGTLIVSESPRWPGYVAQIGLDFVFIDTEHVALDRRTLAYMCATYTALGLPPIVRIPSPDPYAATMALDAGAQGIVAPYIETAEEVRRLTGAVKLRPLKGARLEAMLSSGARAEPLLDMYQKSHYIDNILIVNIESRPAIENLDSILAVEGLDGVLIGPHDLSCSLGIPEMYDAPEFDAAVREIGRRARARNVGAGFHSWMGVRREVSWAKDGFNFLIHSGDIIAMKDTLTAEIHELRTALGDTSSLTDRQAENI